MRKSMRKMIAMSVNNEKMKSRVVKRVGSDEVERYGEVMYVQGEKRERVSVLTDTKGVLEQNDRDG